MNAQKECYGIEREMSGSSPQEFKNFILDSYNAEEISLLREFAKKNSNKLGDNLLVCLSDWDKLA
jgi:hypothetical protein